MGLRVLTYNIHKGRAWRPGQYVLREIKEAIHSTRADIVFLQEIHGHHPNIFNNDEDLSPLELLAHDIWPHHTYGRNAVYTNGHHGNAILSKYPIKHWENIDISTTPFAKRGLLHAAIQLPWHLKELHLICLHLDLFEFARRKQLQSILNRVRSHVDDHSPLIMAGDFNDWRQKATPLIYSELALHEAQMHRNGRHFKTFPSWWPLLSLDRIYFRGLDLGSCQCLDSRDWRQLSDHLPLLAEFEYE